MKIASVTCFFVCFLSSVIFLCFTSFWNKTKSGFTFTKEKSSSNKNLIINGNFEEGNTGFTSTYLYLTDTMFHGHYTVTNDISKLNNNFNIPFGDHTSGQGNYMVVDSKIYRYSHRSKVWISNPIKVKPNTTYIFSAWVHHAKGPGSSTPEVEITIKDKPIGKSFIIDDQAKKWQQIYYEWNSGKTKGKQELAIENIYRYQYVEDFAIDDIFFGIK